MPPPITFYDSIPGVKEEHALAVAPGAREDPTRCMWRTILQYWIDKSEVGRHLRLALNQENHPPGKVKNRKGKEGPNQHRMDLTINGMMMDGTKPLRVPIVIVECKRQYGRTRKVYYDEVVQQLKARCDETARQWKYHTILGLAIVGEDVRMFYQTPRTGFRDAVDRPPGFVPNNLPQTFISIKHTDSQLIWRALEYVVGKVAPTLMPRSEGSNFTTADMVETANRRIKATPSLSPSPGPSNSALPPSQAQQQRSNAASSSRKPQEVELTIAPRKQQKDRKTAAPSGKLSSLFGRGSKTANERNTAQQSKALSSSYAQPTQRSTASSSSHVAQQQRPATSSSSQYPPRQRSFPSKTSDILVQQRPTTSRASHHPPQQQSFVSSTSHYPPQQRPTTSSQAHYQPVQQQPAANSSRHGKQKMVEVTPNPHYYHSTQQQQQQQQQLNASSSRQGIQYQQIDSRPVPTASDTSRSDVQQHCRGYFRYLTKHMTQQTAEEYIIREAAALRNRYGGSMQQAYAHLDTGDYAEMLVTALRTNRI